MTTACLLCSCLFLLASPEDCALPRALPVTLSAQRPRILLTPVERDALRARVNRDPWAARVRGLLLAEADTLAAAPLDIPRREGQWSHWYVGEAGNRLTAQSPTQHVDPLTGSVYTGSPYDEVYAAQRHGFWLRGVQTLGMAYALEPRPEYAGRVRAILLEYASFYASLRKHTKDGHWSRRGARLFAQTLDEAVILCHIAAGYDLVYDAPCFSPWDHERIRKRLIHPMVRVVLARDMGESNWQAWHNAAIGVTGYLLNEKRLVDRALNGQSGLLFQLEHSLMPSGLWYELAPIYHWYALNAYVYLFEGAERSGTACYGLPKVRAMFDAPPRSLLPDRTFAPLQDSDRLALSDDRWFYEVAFRRYREPRFASLAGPRPRDEALLHKSEDLPESRALGLEAAALALFLGAETLPEPPAPLEWRSSNDPGEGLAVLRGQENQTVLLLEYGPARAGHVQPAKLNIVLYAAGDIRLVDPGRAPYGHPLHQGWFRQTLAHNTVVVDESCQQPAQGSLRVFATGPEWSLVRAASDGAYPGVLLDRTVLLYDNIVVDVFRAFSNAPRTFDLPLHFKDPVPEPPETTPIDRLPSAPGYRELREVRLAAASWREFLVKTGTEHRLHVSMLDHSEVWLADGPCSPGRTEGVPVVIRRRQGTESLFITVLQVLASGAPPCPAAIREDGTVFVGDNADEGLSLRVERGNVTVTGASRTWRYPCEGEAG